MIQLTPSDVERALRGIGAFDNPVRAATSFLGLSADEQKAGVPAWAWMTLALGAGILVGRNIKWPSKSRRR